MKNQAQKTILLLLVAVLMAVAGYAQWTRDEGSRRGGFGGGLNTSQTGGVATAPRPEPDGRGVISYPGYQVAVARRGDTIATLSLRSCMEVLLKNVFMWQDGFEFGPSANA